MLRPRLPALRLAQRMAGRTRLSALDTLEIYGPAHADDAAVDLVLSRTTPRAGHGRPYLDVGLLRGKGSDLLVRSAREAAGARDGALTPPAEGAWRASWAGVSLDLVLDPIAERGGTSLVIATGSIKALDESFTLHERPLFLSERRAARRPYAWARATLFGEVEGAPVVCVVETGRRRAGSVVLPELGRIRIFGPGASALPRDCVTTQLPVRAEYGTGNLRVGALSPSHKLSLELSAPPDDTALFEMVDPDGEACYAHRAGDAVATLTFTRRRRTVATLALTGRFEWGARAGDPRVAHRAWRS
jgi:hypothetical protein